MTQAAVASSADADSESAGAALGREIRTGLGGGRPDAVIVFASARHDYEALLRGLKAASEARVIVGCSSAGEFASTAHHTGSASAVGLLSTDLRFSSALVTGLRDGHREAAQQLARSFTGEDASDFRYRYALVLTDALAGHANEFVGELTELTGGAYQFFGGGACDDGRFEETHVFSDSRALPDAVVALEILARHPLGIGVQHGWTPAGAPMRVTESDGRRLVSLDAAPAVEAFEQYARDHGQPFDRADPIPFFLHNVLGIDTGDGFRLSVPLAVDADGSLTCAADVPAGTVVRIMRASEASAVEAAAFAASAALDQLAGAAPAVALIFDCVATRLRLGPQFDAELRGIQDLVGDQTHVIGCNTNGQIARGPGQFNGFHNCTAVIAMIPR